MGKVITDGRRFEDPTWVRRETDPTETKTSQLQQVTGRQPDPHPALRIVHRHAWTLRQQEALQQLHIVKQHDKK